jgi:hypothetical protein
MNILKRAIVCLVVFIFSGCCVLLDKLPFFDLPCKTGHIDTEICVPDDSACIVEDYPNDEYVITLPGSIEPMPDPIEPMPDPIEPMPDSIELMPDPVEPIPDPVEPVPIKQPKICTGEKVSKHWHNLNKVVVATNFLNIRSNYGVNQPVIGSAKRCEKLTVIGKHVERVRGNKKIKSRGWLKIVTQSGVTGWVAGWHTGYIED